MVRNATWTLDFPAEQKARKAELRHLLTARCGPRARSARTTLGRQQDYGEQALGMALNALV
jgi:hypothetical protein